MEKEIEPFADEEYEPLKLGGRTILQLRADESRHKKVVSDKIMRIYDAMRQGWDIKIHYAIIDGEIDVKKMGLPRDKDGNSFINGDIEIVNSEIRGEVDFWKTVFGGEVSIHGTTFGAKAGFRNAIFKQSVDFGSVTFTCDADFGDVVFRKTASFVFAIFTQSAFFSYACFYGAVNFYQARFTKRVTFVGSVLSQPAVFGEVKLDENTVSKGLWNYIFHPILRGPFWLDTVGKVTLDKAIVTDIYSINTNTVMDASSNPRLKRYIDDEQWIESWRMNPNGRWWREPIFRLWELTSHCGRSIKLWAFWSLLIAFVFGFLHNGHIVIKSVHNWYTPFYFSVVTFTTLGFGDVKPADWIGQFWITLEVVLGYVMLGGLISIFANKFARRS